ncbi:hypothetical protein TIFTF001_035442 [Ficus carica]|uniref:Ubiquitin-like protease family profile domain-containing protein n=1 Tax=Ficus carica TaxID=3494 RepID=A0AA88J9P9_FICCA|nr:hypothetical protein TIFTF001_035442 [Ficus carica]
MTDVVSPSKPPSKLLYALPPGLTDEPLKDVLEEFRKWFKKGILKRTPSRIMLGVRVQSGASWFDVNTVLMPIQLGDLNHWALVKLELTNWTIKVYDSLQYEGPHNSKVRAGMEGLSKFIPLMAEKTICSSSNHEILQEITQYRSP